MLATKPALGMRDGRSGTVEMAAGWLLPIGECRIASVGYRTHLGVSLSFWVLVWAAQPTLEIGVDRQLGGAVRAGDSAASCCFDPLAAGTITAASLAGRLLEGQEDPGE